MKPNQIKRLIEHSIVQLRIQKKTDFQKMVNEYKINENEKVVFIPKNEENKEKYGTYLYYSLKDGVWMGQFSLFKNGPKIKSPKNVMNPEMMRTMAKKEQLIPGMDYNVNNMPDEKSSEQILETVEDVIRN